MPRATTILLIVLFVFSFSLTIILTNSHSNIHETSVRTTAWNNDGTYLVSGDDHGKVVLWHGGLQITRGYSFTGEIIHLSFKPNTTADILAISYMSDGNFKLAVVEITALHSLNSLMVKPIGEEIRDISWSPNGEYLIAVTPSDLIFYETTSWIENDPYPKLDLFYGGFGDLFSIDFHPTKNLVAVLGYELILFDLYPGNFTPLAISDFINHYPNRLGAPGQNVRWNKDGTTIACGGSEEMRFFHFSADYLDNPYFYPYYPSKQLMFNDIDYEPAHMFSLFEWSTVSAYRGIISTGLNVYILDFSVPADTFLDISFTDPIVSANAFITSISWAPVDPEDTAASNELDIAISTVASSVFLTTASGGYDELNPEEFYSIIAMFAFLCILFAVITWVTSIIQNYFDIRYYRSNIPSLPFSKSESQLQGELGSSIILPIEDWTPRVLFPGKNRKVIHVNSIDHLYELLQEKKIPSWDYKRKPRYYFFSILFLVTSFISGREIMGIINEQIDQYGSLAAGLSDVSKTGQVVFLAIVFAINLLLFFRSSQKWSVLIPLLISN
jgi:WD40 repeat protein